MIVVLAQQIPVVLPNLLNKLDETRYRILKQIADRGGRTFLPLGSHQLDYFKHRGLIFAGTYTGQRTLALPREVLEGIKNMNGPSYGKTIRRNTEWIKLTQGMLYYYGILGLNDLSNLVKHHTGTDVHMRDYLSVLDDSQSFWREIRLDTKGVSNIRLFDVERVKQEHQSRPNLSLYPFTKSQLLRAGEPGFVDRNPSYAAFVNFITKTNAIALDAADNLVKECVYAIQIGESSTNILQFLQYQFEIDELNLMEAFMSNIVALHNNTRQWFIKGYTPYELSPTKNIPSGSLSGAKAAVVDFATRKKVGRNDACPCGMEEYL